MEYGCKQKKPARVGRFDVKWITYECCNILMKSQIQVWLPLEIFIKPKSYIRECIKNLVAKFISTDAIRGWNQPGPYIYNFGAGQRKWFIYVYNFGAGQENNLSHGPLAQVRMAPVIITDIFPLLKCNNKKFLQTMW